MKKLTDITRKDLQGRFFIGRDGRWHHNGTPFPEERLSMVRLFAQYLTRKQDGSFWIQVNINGRTVDEAEVIVEEAPFVAVAVERKGKGREQILEFRTNLGDIIALGGEHPLRVDFSDAQNPRPYIQVRDGLDALLDRSVFYELADMVEVGKDGKMGVWSHKKFFPLEP